MEALRDNLLTDETDSQIGCALRSGIPTCCIKYWVEQFDHFPINKCREYLDVVPNWVQYVPCPKCVESKNFINIKLCEEPDYKICTVGGCSQCRKRNSLTFWRTVIIL